MLQESIYKSLLYEIIIQYTVCILMGILLGHLATTQHNMPTEYKVNNFPYKKEN